MKRLLPLLALAGLLFASPSLMAQSCDATVADDGSALEQGQAAQIQTAAIPLINQGADVKVRTVPMTTNLDMNELQYEKACSSWQGANGGRKNSLIVLMVSPAGRKLGIYYGSAWKSALDDHWNRIKSDYMAPKFRDKDWAGGFIATEQQLTARITASKDEALHPVNNVTTTNVTEQAADYNGLWSSFKWGLLILALGGLLAFGLVVYFRRKNLQDAIEAAQQAAVLSRNSATDKINRYKAEVVPASQAAYDLASEDFSRLMNSERTNPDTPGLSADQYNTIQIAYSRICESLDNTFRPSKRRYSVRHSDDERPDPVVIPNPTAYTPQPTGEMARDRDTTVVVPIPLIVDEPEERHRVRDPEPEPEPEHHHHHSSDDDDSSSSSGGGSSSWGGSSDSGSSGGSSDFGGGFGGGGGSDFGGGSSGGGGSDSF